MAGKNDTQAKKTEQAKAQPTAAPQKPNPFDSFLTEQAGGAKKGYDEASRRAFGEATKQRNKEIRELYGGALTEAFSSEQAYTAFLDVYAQAPHLSASNAMLIYGQDKTVTVVASREEWRRQGLSVAGNAKELFIRKPARNNSGYFDIVPVFDVSQTYNNERYVAPKRDTGLLTHAIVYAAGCKIEKHENVTPEMVAVYDPHANTIYVNPHLDFNEMYFGIARETAHKQFAALTKQDYNRADFDFAAESAGYVVCRHYGVEVKRDFSSAAEIGKQLDRDELNQLVKDVGLPVQNAYRQMEKSIDFNARRGPEQAGPKMAQAGR